MPDYRTIIVDGPAAIYYGAANCSASAYTAPTLGTNATDLGFTDNGVQISINSLTHRVNSDDCGGSEGNPAEILLMGAQGTIRGTLVKHNTAALAALISGINSANPLGLPGTPLFANNYGFSFWIVGRIQTYWFPMCEIASTPREFNFSTTERRTTFGINAYPVRYTAGSGNDAYCAQALYFTGAAINTAICNSCPTVQTSAS